MKAQHYREMSSDEREMKLQELQKHLYELHCQVATEKLANCKATTNMRRDIARLKTIMHETQKH